MRRLRETGIVTILLLGLTGCAGVQQRLGWTETPSLGGEDSEDRPLSRLAFWRRHKADETTSASDLAASGRSSAMAANDATADDDERPGLLRRLPLVGRLWHNDHRDESDDLDMPAPRYAPVAMNSPSVASGSTRTPVNTGMIPASGAPTTGPAIGTGSPIADSRPAPANPIPTDEPTASTGPDEQPLRELTVDLAGEKPQVDASAVPAGNPGTPPPISASTGEAAPPAPTLAGLQAPGNLPEPPPVPSIGRGTSSSTPSAAPGPQPNLPAPDLSPATTTRGPSLPSPTVNSEPELASGSTPGSSWGQTLVSTPGPVMPASSQVTFSGSSQSIVMTSPQGSYVSGGCEESCGPKCKAHKLCPLKKHKQVAATSVVYPSGQGAVSSCDAVPCKKECFLKKWLHHKAGCKTKGCKGCKSCAYCGEPAAMVSAQSPIVSPQW